MKTVIIWNVRGVGNKATVNSLAQHIREKNISVAAISEPRVPFNKAQKIGRRIGLSNVFGNNGEKSKIWVFYRDDVSLEVVEENEQFLTIVYKEMNEIISYFTVIYASCSREHRRCMFESLMSFSTGIKAPWLLGGDFNCIASPDEKVGGLMTYIRSMTDFQGFIAATGLIDAGYEGAKYTWTNNQIGSSHIKARLDRVMVNASWIQGNKSVKVKHLYRGPSDHSPMLLQFNTAVSRPAPGRFIYQQMWHTHEQFLDFVKGQWNKEEIWSAHPFEILQRKMKQLKIALRSWNKEVFGDIHKAKEDAETKVNDAQIIYDEAPSLENKINLQKANAQLRMILHREEIFWHQKSRVKWLSYGDRNTHFFHQYTKIRRHLNTVHRLKINDIWVEDQETLINGAVDHFSNLLSSEDHNVENDIFHVIPKIITDAQNDLLCGIPSPKEIRDAVFSLPGSSSPGPDGFSGDFFTHCWDIIHEDVVKAVQSFYCGWGMPQGVTSTLLCLLPKVQKPIGFADFRPVSLCNFSYKIVSKIMCDRLGALLPSLISKEQSGFVSGRLITENILLAKEIMADIDRPVRGHNTILKLDMAKAYDRVEWDYLFKMLRLFGFSNRFVSLIAQMISNCWFTISMNGISRGYFKSTRGLRQGDPLAPALFIIAEELLSRGLSHLFLTCKCKYFHLARDVHRVSHILFADDSVIFMNGELASYKQLIRFLNLYETVSGQKVNAHKSCFMASKNMPKRSIDRIVSLTGFQHKSGSMKYLGTPLFKGRNKVSHYSYLIEKISAKLGGWQSKLLSQAGRLTLIKSVLDAVPLYSASTISIPYSILSHMGKICANFFWRGFESEHRKHWVAWDQLCTLKSVGGIGIRNQRDMQLSFSVKMLWLAIHSNSL